MSDGNLSRREYVTQGAAAAALAAGLAGCIGGGNGGNGDNETGTLEYGAIATADAGDWSDFVDESGWELSFSTISNTPGELLSTLIAGGGRELYDVLGPVGGIQPPLASEGAIQPVDTDQLDNWDAQYDYWETDQGRDFISHEGDIYGIPIVWQGDSIAYLPDEVGEITSYGALFDEEYAGQVAIEDNYTTAGQKTAMYLDHHDIEDIENPRNMTASEFEAVVDFLIEQKESGQFRTMWSGYENAVNLMSSGEVVVMDTWEPVVFDLRDQGINAEYAEPEEGYLLWALADYVVNPEEGRSDAREEAIYDFLDWSLAGWYGATITKQTGYMTNPAAIEYAEESDEFDADEIREIHEGVSERFEVGGSWQQRWPDEREVYEEQWERLRSA